MVKGRRFIADRPMNRYFPARMQPLRYSPGIPFQLQKPARSFMFTKAVVYMVFAFVTGSEPGTERRRSVTYMGEWSSSLRA